LLTFKQRQKWRIASLIFEWAELPSCPVEFTTLHYNLLIGACARRAPQRALDIFSRMQIKSVATNVVTHNTAMSAALALDSPAKALQIFTAMKDHGCLPSTIS